jgi:hypothetical protein
MTMISQRGPHLWSRQLELELSQSPEWQVERQLEKKLVLEPKPEQQLSSQH